ncbi:MAG: group II intron reverse transcriptase/maturase [Alphaproteobacteria bacterium]|nr:group II intron reverse transcriptase/maturase [Alphaproteobacteria bacterium]MCB9758916.1 group II intron reverse transcriptase/maturase [Alphaproteobacteria bacterium]MCB9759463.1 group II intron reverse transcriptase/maturase [Alphaproteobacteria bacterium]MCB9759926.1 group II intron reverse transcriptase/maturase [Alphaproteobacteria bacterium]MCB9762728.1 group II intron reverse transcriptase/maturase [Alphaproteobacteria bacterium]
MEEVTERLSDALQKVAANSGAPGPDGETIAQVRKRWARLEPCLQSALLEGRYQPGEIRRVQIPKPGGGERGLGIPNVVDRVVQEAVRQVLEPLYEPTFHRSSHGFRPGRSCHTALTEAKRHVKAGHAWVVDIDLEKFFDRVNHQRLMARLAERVADRRLLVLIGQMLKAGVVLPDGVVVATDEGVPQGGPLSPLLSNVVLDELDRELVRRGHRFVRYADDMNVFVRSERAGQRVMASLTRFIERRLRLKVNAKKSAVARPEDRHFLGFRLTHGPTEGTVEVRFSERTIRRAKARHRELTPRNWGGSMKGCIARLNVYLRGWFGFFGVVSARERSTLQSFDAHIRRRLRAIQLKHWKRKRTIAMNLIARGVKRKTAWRRVYEGRKSLWPLSHDPAVDRALRNAYFAERGLVSLEGLLDAKLQALAAPAQLSLMLG